MYSFKLWLMALLATVSMQGGAVPDLAVSTSSTAKITDNKAGSNITLHGWLPFWAKASGTIEMLNHKEYFSSISPFSMDVSQGGLIYNRFNNDSIFSKMINDKERKYKIVPTIAWFNADEIDEVMSSSSLRKFHIGEISRIVRSQKYDGIDIDYEGKYMKTKSNYSTFIKELGYEMHKYNKLLYCTTEARTPDEDRFYGYKKYDSHTSDYKVLNRYCDSVRIMAYDQRDDDKKLVFENGNTFYRPVADYSWVEKTIKEAIYEISRNKIVIGIPTYGNVYRMHKDGKKYIYSYVSAMNYRNAMEKAKEFGVEPLRNKAGELEFSYKKDNYTYFVTFSDAVSVKKKLILAERYNLKGVSIFKIDGGMDPDIWPEIEYRVRKSN